MTSKLTKDDYIKGVNAQDACNLSGVLHSFATVIKKIWCEANEAGTGTVWVNTHPLSIIYTCKLASLAGLGIHNDIVFSDAYLTCCRRAEGKEKIDE